MATTPEAKFQQVVVKWLRSKHCVVIKCQQNATTRVGVADLVFFHEGFYGFLECKRAKNAPVRPGQKQFIQKMDSWSYGRIIYPENWPEVKAELTELLK